MTDPQANPDNCRHQAHADLFDKLSKLRAMLGMLHADGFDHFRTLDGTRQAEYLWTCMEYADSAYQAMVVADGLASG